MTERGLPIADGPVACPFVAFDDDRDERATSPDRRHRCYAEDPPAPRAIAHQEAYCLSSAFPVCPTFQDWARREAARARDTTPDARTGAVEAPVPGPVPGAAAIDAGMAASSLDDDEDLDDPIYEDRPRRNPQRGWASPPPWLSRSERGQGSAGGGPDDDDEDHGAGGEAPADAAAGGLAGSFADRLVSGSETGANGEDVPAWRHGDKWDDELPAESSEDAWEPEEEPAPVEAVVASPSRQRQRERFQAGRPEREKRPSVEASRAAGDRRTELDAPTWERPARLEAYPALRSRRLPSISVPPILLAVAALVLAALLVFLLPGFLGFGGGGPAGASPSLAPQSSLLPSSGAPTAVPGPTQQLYVVQAGDTMSRIANKFHIPLATLIEVNRTTIPNPDSLQIGQQVTIPTTIPTALPDASTAP
jgi:hypothetical protein